MPFFSKRRCFLKKKQVHASEQKRPDVEEARKTWQEEQNDIEKFPADRLVFLDESGINTNMTRRYGRSVGKTRVVDKVPCNTPTSTTVVSSIRLDGTYAYELIDGSIKVESFVEYIKVNIF